uniref:Uncharacterized protein n=1 Tax=Anguilla anguilla TaxID=7936 RepID=A0A0E9STS2_ANGAN
MCEHQNSIRALSPVDSKCSRQLRETEQVCAVQGTFCPICQLLHPLLLLPWQQGLPGYHACDANKHIKMPFLGFCFFSPVISKIIQLG